MQRVDKPFNDGYYWFKYRGAPDSDLQIVYVRIDSSKGASPQHYHAVFVDFERSGVQSTHTLSSDQLGTGLWWGPIAKPNG
jgi:hypothetical protein